MRESLPAGDEYYSYEGLEGCRIGGCTMGCDQPNERNGRIGWGT